MNTEQDISRSKSKKIELIIQQLNSLPTLPAIAARLLQLTVKKDTQAADIVELIQSDPALSARIIAMATRANAGMRKQTASLSKVVVFLGFDAVRNAVLSIKVFETLGKTESSKETHGFDRTGFWKHSLAVACAARMLIPYLDKRIDSEEAFLCGLLHDMGKVALDACLPKSYARVVEITESGLGNIAHAETKILGLDHTIVGKRLAEKWNLPETISDTVWLHHQSPKGIPDSVKQKAIVRAVHLADILAREQRIGYSGNHDFSQAAAEVADQMGLKEEILDQIVRVLRSEISDRAMILGLDEMNPDDLYQEALIEANTELGKFNFRLQQQNNQLQLRSKYFHLLVNLSESVQPGQPVVDICSLVAELWQKHLNASQCAVYAYDSDTRIIEGAVKLDTDAKATVFLVDQTEDPAIQGREDTYWKNCAGFSVEKADSRHQWFFEQVAPMFDPAETFAIPLLVGEDIIGGVLWSRSREILDYSEQIKELQSFACSATMAILQSQKHERQMRITEELAQKNTLLHEAQQELLIKRSLAAVGEMACGAAHEINNPLAVVVGRSQLLATSEQDQKRREMLEAISKQGQEIANIITELLNFAKPELPQYHSVSVEGIVQQAVLHRQADADQQQVAFKIHLDTDLPEIFVDAEQISSALEELIRNAIESYQGQSGTVRITARHNELGNEVILEVQDKGVGMDKQTLEKAVTPFFSSKPSGRRRGLGLSRSTRHIANNGGRLNLISDPGQGCTARITLPVSRVPEFHGIASD